MVLVTGGTGFLGAYIIKNLVEKNIKVRAIRRSANTPFFIPPAVLNKVEWVEGDVLDIIALDDAMKGVEGVIHSAAVVSFGRSNRQDMYNINIEGTANVVNLAIENNIQRLVHVSSVAALGRTAKRGTLITENKKWEESKVNTHYAITKHKSELEVWRGFAEGLQGAIINPTTILGYGNWHHSSTAIFKSVYKQFPWYTKGINGFVGVEDVAEAAVQLLTSTITNKRFIVNAENLTFQYVFNTIAEGFNKRKPYLHATPFLGEIAWRIEALKSLFTGKKPLLTKETAKVAHSITELDNSALLKVLPNFKYTPIEVVIKDACLKYEQALKNNSLSL